MGSTLSLYILKIFFLSGTQSFLKRLFFSHILYPGSHFNSLYSFKFLSLTFPVPKIYFSSISLQKIANLLVISTERGLTRYKSTGEKRTKHYIQAGQGNPLEGKGSQGKRIRNPPFPLLWVWPEHIVRYIQRTQVRSILGSGLCEPL